MSKFSNKEECEYFTPPNALKAKVGGLDVVDPTVVTEAEAKLAELQGAYLGWIETDPDTLIAAPCKLEDGPGATAGPLAVIEGTAHEIKGQAGTFNYPLISLVAGSLCDMVRGTATIADRQIEVVEAHIDAIGVIGRGRIQGDGGDIGEELRSRLQTAVRKVST